MALAFWKDAGNNVRTETGRESLKHQKSCGAVCFARAGGALRVQPEKVLTVRLHAPAKAQKT